MADYLIHKACERKNLLVPVRKRLTDAVLEEFYIAQPKYDGCNLTIVVFDDLSTIALSRTGEIVKCVEEIKLAAAAFKTPGAYLGEFWHYGLDIYDISGAFRRQSEQAEGFQFVVLDYLTLNEWLDGKSEVGYFDRVVRLPELLGRVSQRGDQPMYCGISFGHLQQLGWTIDDTAQKLVASGGFDGLIMRDPNGTWTRNDMGKNGEIIKVKPTIRLTLKLVEVLTSVGDKTGRDVYRLTLADKAGREYTVGSGVPHTHGGAEWAAGTLHEVEAMGRTVHGDLREPRYKGRRTDAEQD